MQLAGIVLCGGLSRRMGQEKASLPFGSETLLERVTRLLGLVTEHIVIVAAPADVQPLVNVPPTARIVRDPVVARGPLQGLVTGLEALKPGVDLAYVTAVDTPFFNGEWVHYLVNVIGQNDIAVPLVGEKYQTLSAVYRPTTVLPVARSLLERSQFRLNRLLEFLECRIVSERELRRIDPQLEFLRNLNTPEEYQRAIRDLNV